MGRPYVGESCEQAVVWSHEPCLALTAARGRGGGSGVGLATGKQSWGW